MKNKDLLETCLAGLVYVILGTAFATTSVSAQNKSVAPSPTPTGPASCAPVETPDAMCTVPLKKGPEAKICFGDHHPRCFELKAGHLYQSDVNGLVKDSALSPEQQSNVRNSITTYSKWLESGLGKKANASNICANTVTIESANDHKVFCLLRLPKKEVDAKTNDLMATLEAPLKSMRSSAL